MKYYAFRCIFDRKRKFCRSGTAMKRSIKMSGLFKKFRKAAAVVIAAACVLTFSGCDEEEEEEIPMKTVAVTNLDGEIVTDDKGEPVMTEVPLETVARTDEEGNLVTDENGEQVYDYETLPEEPKTVWKVGFVYSGYVDDGATNGSFEVARAQLERSLGVDTCYVENVLVADFPDAVNTLQDEGCNIIVACSPKYGNSAAKEARSSSSTYYLAFGGDSQVGLMSSFGGELYQTASVCGLAAAHNTKSNTIGVIADPGEYNVYGVVDAFVLGAAEIWSAHTDVRVNWAWSSSKSEIEAAVDDLIAQGSDIIMSYMETDYAIRYASGKGVKVIGNCYDLPEVAPDNYITGFFFNFSTYLVDEVRSIINDNFESRIYEGDVASGMARLVSFGPDLMNGTEDICKTLYDYIKEGKAETFMGEIKNTDGKIMVEKGQIMNFANILKINWLVQGIRKMGTFTEIIDNPVGSDFSVHYDFKKEALESQNIRPEETTTAAPADSAAPEDDEPQAEIVE